MQQSALHCRRL